MENQIICRCEEIRKQQIVGAIRDGCMDIDAVKKTTRAGMGLCQGRTCQHLVRKIITEETGIPPDMQDAAKVRAPFRSIPMEAMAKAQVKEPKGGEE